MTMAIMGPNMGEDLFMGDWIATDSLGKWLKTCSLALLSGICHIVGIH
jgi:hypothetical protein